MRKGLSLTLRKKKKTLKALQSLLSMDLAGLFLYMFIFPTPRDEHETFVRRIVLSSALLQAASNSKQKSLGLNFNFHLFQVGTGLKYNFALSINNSVSNTEREVCMQLKRINCFPSTIKSFRNSTFDKHLS